MTNEKNEIFYYQKVVKQDHYLTHLFSNARSVQALFYDIAVAVFAESTIV
jgi:hypothetical protein